MIIIGAVQYKNSEHTFRSDVKISKGKKLYPSMYCGNTWHFESKELLKKKTDVLHHKMLFFKIMFIYEMYSPSL